jgi:hypothetical protein
VVTAVPPAFDGGFDDPYGNDARAIEESLNLAAIYSAQANALAPPHPADAAPLPAAPAATAATAAALAALTAPRRMLWTCLACTFGNDPDQGLCEVCHSPKENAKLAPAAAGVASAAKKKASKSNSSKAAAAATAALELSAPSATAAEAGVVDTCLVTGAGYTAKELEGRRIAADGGFYTKQEFFDFYKGVSEWTEANFASHCIHHPKGKCHKGDLCRY